MGGWMMGCGGAGGAEERPSVVLGGAGAAADVDGWTLDSGGAVYWGAAGGAAGAAGGGASVGGGSAVFIARGDYVWSRSAETGRGFWRQLLSTSRSHQNSRAT